MQKKGANISLKGYDDIFSTDQSRAEAQQERVQEIPLSELHPFEGHPFRVVDDEEMMKTAESVRDFGVLTPAIVRPDPDGGYEIVSGHRRHRASELAGKETMPAIVRDLDDDIQNRLVCFDIKELGNQLKKIGMLIVQDQVWGRVTANRSAGKSTRYYIDEFHLLLKEEQTATYSVEIWKRFRKWGGLPTGITQNVKDLLRSPEIANILENSDFIYMLNQASDDRSILAQRLNISPHQLSYVTNSGEGEGLLFYGNVILPFIDRFPTDLELYRIMTTKLNEVAQEKEA